jgi:hypothetical protein
VVLPRSILTAEAAPNPREAVLIDLENARWPTTIDEALVQAPGLMVERVTRGIDPGGYSHDPDSIADS